MKLIDILKRRCIRYILKPYFKAYSYKKLKSIKGHQLIKFRKNQKKFNELYQSIKSKIAGDMTDPTWEDFNSEMEKQLLPYPEISFFKSQIFLKTMTSDVFKAPHNLFLNEIVSHLKGFDINELLTEDLVGMPTLLNDCPLCKATSGGRIMHLYQASICSKVTSAFENTSIVTEWGGGFGGLARIFNKIEGSLGKTFTYNIIDLPIMCCVQWLYLSSIFKEERINLIVGKESKCENGKINIIPNGLAFEFVNKLRCDLFISAWALSESSLYAQEFVANNGFFNARHGLIIHQPSSHRHPYAENLKGLLRNNGIVFEEQQVPHMNSETALFW